MRRRVDRSNCSLAELAYLQTGSIRKAGRIVTFILTWGVQADELGREPTVEEYAERWGESRRTAFNQQSEFREAFPGHETPAAIVRLLEARSQTARADFSGLLPA